MEKGLTGSVDTLLRLGLPGVIILVLLYAVYKLAKAYDCVQEKRILEAREATKAMTVTALAMETLTDTIRDRRNV